MRICQIARSTWLLKVALLFLALPACGEDPSTAPETNAASDAPARADGGTAGSVELAPNGSTSQSDADGFRTLSRLVEVVTLDHLSVQFTCDVSYRFRVAVSESSFEEEAELHTVNIFTQEAAERRISQLRLREIMGKDAFLSSEMLEAMKLRTNDFGRYKDNVDYSRVNCHDLKAEMPMNSAMTDPEGLCLAPSQLDDYLTDWIISGPQLVKTSDTHWVCKYDSRDGAITLAVDTAITLEQFAAAKTTQTSSGSGILVFKDETNFYGTEVHERKSTAVFGWKDGATVSVEASAPTGQLLAVAKAVFAQL